MLLNEKLKSGPLKIIQLGAYWCQSLAITLP